MISIQTRAEEAYASKNIDALAAIANEVANDGLKDPATSRVFTLLGEMHRRGGRAVEAVSAYSTAHDPPTRANIGALYGLAECYATLKDTERFEARVAELIASGKINANLASRLMVSAATLGRRDIVNRLAELRQPTDEVDARYWLRRATASFRLGQQDEVATFAAKARAAATDDPQVQLELAELEYDPSKYWDMRYNAGGGERAPVPPAWRGDAAYAERTAREHAYLRDTFNRAFGSATRFRRAADCGCGSGRMTAILKERVRELDCYDISDTALNFARENTRGLPGVFFRNANLADVALPAEAYDLVFDFVVVQHQSDEQKWKSTLANYAQAARTDGYVFLIEQRGDDGPNKAPHVRNASPAAYRRELEANGCEIVFEELTPWSEICFIARKGAFA